MAGTRNGTHSRRFARVQDMSVALAAIIVLLSIMIMFTAAQAKGKSN